MTLQSVHAVYIYFKRLQFRYILIDKYSLESA